MAKNGDGVEMRENSIRVNFTYEGKRVRETLQIAPTPANQKHAIRMMVAVRRAIANGTFSWAEYFPDSKRAQGEKTTRQSFGELCALWLKTKGQLSKKSRDQYRNALEVWKGLLGAATPMDELTHGIVAAKVGDHAWASAKLLNNYLIPLRGVFRLAARELGISDSMEGVDNAKHQIPSPDPLSPQEMESVLRGLKADRDPRVHAYFVFAFMTGMRPEELIALRWSDVDWNAGTIRVERAKTAGELKPLKTYNARDVDLVRRAIEALEAMKPWTQKIGDDPEIFQNPVTNRPWHDERSQRDHYWSPILKTLSIRKRRAYQTRHTYATIALAAGVNPSYIARQMGHKNGKMLFTVYAKWIDGADRGREKAKLEQLHSASQGHSQGH